MKVFLVSVTLILTMCNSSEQKRSTEMPLNQKHKIIITDCGITYNGTELVLGEPVDKWIEVLGPYNRKFMGYMAEWGSYVFDSIGVLIDFDEEKKTEGLYIYLVNLDDEGGKRGYLRSARDYTSYFSHLSKGDFGVPTNYFKDGISLHGAIIGRGMWISEIQQRLKEQDHEGFTHHDQSYLPGPSPDPYEEDGVGGTYFDLTAEPCKGRYQRIEMEMTAFEPKTSNLEGEWYVAPEYIYIRKFTDMELDIIGIPEK